MGSQRQENGIPDPGHGETIWHDGKKLLTLEGLHRICQHVVRQYVERAPRGVDLEFKSFYRSAIPGIVRVRMGPEYWITEFDNFGPSEAPQVFSVLVESLRSTGAGESAGVIDMRIPIRRLGELHVEARRERLRPHFRPHLGASPNPSQ
ncbi:hypothetical protein [Microbacterium murale]|uniref:Uncharacterized protein n=1 Tax=Microbacterium murale TaxID=1081040 RepID=A0ABU0PAH6_9MICO|nr:hypothetical protein [Microbacterium murale]MDQ0644340.1 hypothetical protein [Microbacterium murale]